AHFALLHGRKLRLIGVPAHVEILLGQQVFVEQRLAAVVFSLGALQIAFVFFDHGLHGADVLVGRFDSGFTGAGIGFSRIQGGLLRRHVGLGLHVFNPRQQLAFTHTVSFLDQQFADLALCVRAYVDVILGFNFSGRS